MHTESPEFLHKVYKTVISAWGAPEHQAKAFADAILAGDLYGKDMQGMGIAMIDHLMMQHGQINMTAEPEIQQERDNFLVVDGHRGLGQYTMTWTMNKVIEKAKKQTFAIGLVPTGMILGAPVLTPSLLLTMIASASCR